MNNTLKNLGVKFTISKGCNCVSSSQVIYNYDLPSKLDASILEYLNSFGRSVTSFEKQAMLKIENPDYAIIGIRRLKQLRLIIKNNNCNNLIESFEDALVKWLERKNE